MSTVKTNNVQIGQSVTATNNGTWYQPATPDGTIRYGIGNAGATTADVVTLSSSGLSASALIPSGSTAPTNGMFLPTTNTLAWSTASTERLRLDSSGNLGLGITPNTWSVGRAMQIGTTGAAISDGSGSMYWVNNAYYNSGWKYITSTSASYYLQAGNSHQWYTAPSGTAGNAITFTQAMTLEASGNLLVGATSFTNYGKLNVYTNSTLPACRIVGGSSTADGTIVLMVDKYSTTNTSSQWFLGFTINNQATASGVITANGASQAAFGTWSDRRLKTNITDLPPQLENILALRPVEFDYIESEGGGHQISFIAQEVEEIYPDAVSEREDGMKVLTGWSKTEARLVKAIQELSAELNEIKQKVNA